MDNVLEKLYDKDDKIAYNYLLELEDESNKSNRLYAYFDGLLEMLNDDKTFVRVRGFRLICHLAKWDIENKINDNIDLILAELNDEKATSVRQCIAKLNVLLEYKPELADTVKNSLINLDLSKYKESMKSLIEKDIGLIKF